MLILSLVLSVVSIVSLIVSVILIVQYHRRLYEVERGMDALLRKPTRKTTRDI